MMLSKTFKSVALASALFLSASASAAIQILDANGKLIGATGVIVEGNSFDVSFVDGTCAQLFSGCDSPLDFAFNFPSSQSAAQALLDQVLLDTTLGLFDTDPSLTRGCAFFRCNSIVPSGDFFQDQFLGTEAQNTDFEPFDFAQPRSNLRSFDTGNSIAFNFAVFSPSVMSAVPEPSTWAMMLLGFGAIGKSMRRKRKVGDRALPAD